MENNSASRSLPLWPIDWPAKSFAVVPSLLAALGTICIVFVFATLAFMVFYLLGLHDFRRASIDQLLELQAIIELPVLPYLMMVLPGLSRFSLRELGFATPSLRSIGLAAAGAVVMIVIVQGSATIIEHFSKAHHQQDAMKLLKRVHGAFGYSLFVATAVVIAPLVEELTFRVFVFNAVLRRAPFLVAAVCSGLLFAAAHADVYALGPLALGGVVLATVYYRTRNAWCSMMTHALFNGVTVAAVLITKGTVI